MKPVIIQRHEDNRTIWVNSALLNLNDGYQRKIKSLYLSSIQASKKRNKFLPVTGKSWRWAKIGGDFYFDYNFIPNNKPCHYKSQLPSEKELLHLGYGFTVEKKYNDEEVIRSLRMEVENKVSNEDIDFYMSSDKFLFGSFRKAEFLAKKKAWLDVITDKLNSCSFIEYGVENQKEFLSIVRIAMEKDNWIFKNANSLRIKYYEYKSLSSELDKREYFLGKYMNDNARKVGNAHHIDTSTGEVMKYDIHQSAIYSLMMNIGGSCKEFKKSLHKKYQQLMNSCHVSPASYATFCKYTANIWSKIHLTLDRDGLSHFNDNYMPYIKSKPVEKAGSLWAVDGSSSKLGYFDSKTGKVKGLYITYIFDIASRKIMGYSMGKNETPVMVLEAFKRAFATSGGYKPLEIISDNGSSLSVSRYTLMKLCKKYRTIGVGNSQANPAESLIKVMVNSCRDATNWLYSSFNAKTITSQANPDNIEARSLPSYEEVQMQLASLIDRFNKTKGIDELTPNERYEQAGVNKACEQINDRDYRFAFGDKTTIDISYMRGFVRVMKDSKEHLYVIPNITETMKRIAKMTGFKEGVQVKVYSDVKVADLYTKEDIYICSCMAVMASSKSTFEFDEASRKGYKDQKDRKKQMLESINVFRQDIENAVHLMPYNITAATTTATKVKDDYNNNIKAFKHRGIEDSLPPLFNSDGLPLRRPTEAERMTLSGEDLARIDRFF